MYDMATRLRAVALVESGMTFSEASRATGISRYAIRQWTIRITPSPSMTAECPLDHDTPRRPYAYLLGLYLGDGCISAGQRSVYALRIACGNAWPGLMDKCEQALRSVLPTSKVGRVRAPGCIQMVSRSKHWPCLFPQHAPGPKHLRTIALTPWQQRIVADHPWELVRGLIHSDGCRITNWTVRSVGGERKRYEYPRYFFTNSSSDIVQIFTSSLDAVGVAWKAARRTDGAVNISIARRDSVALMDQHIGPKS
jgi:hypothetical protein